MKTVKKQPVLKFLLSAMLAMTVIAGSCMTSQSADSAASGNQGTAYKAMIKDDADLLTDEEEQTVYEAMTKNLEFGNMAFVTADTVNGTSRSYAESVYYSNFGNEPGALFLIDMDNRQLWLASSTAMHDKLTDGECDSVTDNIYRIASKGRYADCAVECFEEINTILNNGKIAHTMKYIDNAILALIAALVINFAFAFSTSRKKKIPVTKAIKGAAEISAVTGTSIALGKLTRVYSPINSGGGGGFSGGGGGGGFSGGGGGGGFSGGGGGHGF